MVFCARVGYVLVRKLFPKGCRSLYLREVRSGRLPPPLRLYVPLLGQRGRGTCTLRDVLDQERSQQAVGGR